MVVELSANQIKNLLAFLERVSLSGKEVPAYNEILNALTAAVEKSVEEPKEKK